MFRTRSILPLILIFALTGCKMGYSLPTNESMQLLVFQNGSSVLEKNLGVQDSPIRKAITTWLAANPDGWEYGLITRPPSIYLKGASFSVNVREDEVTVKYCKGILNCHLWIKKDKALYPQVLKLI